MLRWKVAGLDEMLINLLVSFFFTTLIDFFNLYTHFLRVLFFQDRANVNFLLNSADN